MNGIAAAFGATALYYLGFAVFKLAADRMEPLRGNRIVHMIWTILSSWVFLVALAIVLCGLSLQIVALSKLSLGVAVPIFMAGVVPLLLIAMVFFRERLSAREWLSLLLIGGAILLLVASTGNPPPVRTVDVPLWKIGVVVVPALLGPLVLLLFQDYRPDGRHARPITGIAYGMLAGFPVGTAELAIKGWSDSDASGFGVLTTLYPYLTVLAAALGFGILVTAFQRCRVSVVATIMTVSAKTYLLLMGTFMYDEPWPTDRLNSTLRVVALAIGLVAVLQFPRHRPVPHSDLPLGTDSGVLEGDPFGEPPIGPRSSSSGLTGLSRSEYGLASAPTPLDGPGFGRNPFAPGPQDRDPLAPDPLAGDPLGRDPLGRGPYPPDDRQAPPPETGSGRHRMPEDNHNPPWQ
ncbi:DMT family transporter [Actinomadura rubteroloni]|nr:hypothetical protein [Actinomadura rubteroloni]